MTRLIALCIALAAATAHADPRTASELYASGQRDYQLQHYADAATKFLAAYAADPDPVYLFNAAQAFRLGNDCVRAAARYQQFLAKVPNPPNADKIRVWADEMATCAKLRGPEPIKPVDVVPVGPIVPIVPIVPVVPPERPPPPPPPPAHPNTDRRLIAAAITGGLGLVAVGIGGYAAKQGHDDQVRHDAVCPAPCTWSPDVAKQWQQADNRGNAANTRAVIGLAVGSVGVAAGVALFLWARGDAHERQVAIVPTTNGAMFSLAF